MSTNCHQHSLTVATLDHASDSSSLRAAMEWPRYSPQFSSVDDARESSPFTDINFNLDPVFLSPPYRQSSDLFLDSLAFPSAAVPDSLSSPPLPALESEPWPTVSSSPSSTPPSSPSSPTASTSSVSSSASSFTSSNIDHSSPFTLAPARPHAAPTSTAAITAAHSPSIPASLAVSPSLLLELCRSAPVDSSSSEPTAKRKRVAGLTPQQRAELKRQKHREIDANRIQREKAAVKRLTLLTTAQQQQAYQAKLEQKEEEEEAEEGAGGSRRDKVSVLEDSAKKIEELQRLVSRLTDACNSQQLNNRTLVVQLQAAIRQPPASPSSPSEFTSAAPAPSPYSPPGSSHALSLLPTSVSQQLDAHIGSASLHSAWFASSSVSLCVLRCETGCVLDINERMLLESGWSRQHVIGRLVCPPYDYIVSPSSYSEKDFSELSKQRFLIDSPDGRSMVPSRTQPQYPASKALIHELYKGEKQSIFCVFRYQMRDGKVWEIKCALWTASWADVQCDDGVVRRRPETVFMVSSYADSVCVDDVDPIKDPQLR